MYHSITFGDKNTWDDWHLIPKSRPLFNPPEIKTHYVEVPGGDGVIDLTTALTGRPMFGNRTGSLEFYVDNDFKAWTHMYSEIMGYLHGQKMRAILEDEPKYYYEGRFLVNAWKSEAERSSITIDYNVGPYKKSVQSSVEDWIWDTFNFETDVAFVYTGITVATERTIIIVGGNMPVIPKIVCSAAMKVVFRGVTYQLKAGENYLNGIVIQNGENLITFQGSGTVAIRFTWGKL